ncbi:phenoloxidase-activating factor 2-like [Diorhabda carinulata]|uniref:phenoloxidase-activating factor 2-like n=1 Tax=Diorhabda carinulata TaxID=1163345 RepID=UPI0025A1152A|nr:phenoloxidase-activating factor 2-like [Diorhabda carinulata]
MWKYVLFIFNFLLAVTVQSDLRFRRQSDINNFIIETFNNCNCVNYYQCDSNNEIVTDGEGLLEPRLKDINEESQNNTRIICKGGKFEGEIVCCKLNDNNRTESIDFKNSTNRISTEKPIHECGAQRTQINVRIIVDKEDNNDIIPVGGEFPWIAAIYEKDNAGKWVFYCSGALIHPKVILTANHYFHRKNAIDYKVVVTGDVELSSIGKDVNNERNIVEIVNHPKFYSGGLYNDGSLLFLDKPFDISKTNSINTICLPPDNLEMDSGRCLTAGWGKGSTIDGVQVLKKVDLPLVPRIQCQEQLRQTRLGTKFNLHDSFICAGGEKGKDACRGDGGSPLMCLLPGERRYFHMGIVSWGIGCGDENVPGIYTNVIKMKSWIIEELQKKDINL